MCAQLSMRLPPTDEYLLSLMSRVLCESNVASTLRWRHDDGGDDGVPLEAWSLRGTIVASCRSEFDGLSSESAQTSTTMVASLTLPMSRLSAHRLNAATALKPHNAARKHTKECREKEIARSNKEKSEGGGGKEEAGVLQHLLVGAVAGGVSRSVVAPLERVKIEYMIDSGKVAAEGGMMGTLRRIVHTEGAAGLFRGNMLNVLRIAPTKAVELYCFDKYKEQRQGKDCFVDDDFSVNIH